MTIQFSTKTLAETDFKSPKALGAVAALQTDCLVIAYRGAVGGGVGENLMKLDRLTGGAIARATEFGDLENKLGATLILRSEPVWLANGLRARRLLLVALGEDGDLTAFAKAARACAKALSGSGIKNATLVLQSFFPSSKTGLTASMLHERVRLISQLVGEQVYRFGARQPEMKTKPKEKADNLAELTFLVNTKQATLVKVAVREGDALVNGMNLAKDLGNLPPNVCNPSYLANSAKQLSKSTKLKVQVLEEKQIESLGMGAFLAVTKGSETPPKFIVIRHDGGKANDEPIVLVGKGITFDTGGISLKPGEAMDEMKYDMCGAASVMGTMYSVALLNLKRNVIGVIPACENMPSGKASRPGDIVKSMSGQTIEILNTDAEGRLILCDALTYVERFKPKAVIDIATLTGACVIALGSVHSGLFSNNESLSNALITAGQASLDTVWRLPLDAAYQEQLKSNFADMANIGGRPAGSVTAACFLARFTEKYNWAHLDIAGTAWKGGAAKGSTGRPVPLLLNYLLALH